MAFSKLTLQKIAAILKLKEADVEAAAKDTNEVDLKIEDGLETFTPTELATRDENKKQEGVTIGQEMGAKAVKKAAGLDEKSSKDPEKIAQAIAEKAVADAKIKPDEKVTQLTEQVTLLQKSLGEKDKEIEQHKGVAATITRDRKILSHFPNNRADILSDDEYLNIIKANHSFEEAADGTMTVKKDGVLLRDGKTQNAMPVKDAIAAIFTERKGWVSTDPNTPTGRGGKDQHTPTGGFTKKSEVIAHYEAQGVSLTGEGSQKITAELESLKKADPNFDMNN